MYCAKQRGRNNVQCFEPSMDTVTRERVKLESDLHEALARQQFELYYQPKVDTATEYVHSAEALIRWRHPERGLIMPNDFIPMAEECGLIVAIGEWVMREACRQCKIWQNEGLQPLRVAVNVTASQFRHGNLLSVIRRAVDEVELDPRYLELEITESAVMTNPEESTAILEQLSRMGVLVSVDDFGTGYSSMSYLRRFPIDKLKIDRGFVKDLMTRADDIRSCGPSSRWRTACGSRSWPKASKPPSSSTRSSRWAAISTRASTSARRSPAAAFGELMRCRPGPDDSLSETDAIRTHSKLAAYRP